MGRDSVAYAKPQLTLGTDTLRRVAAGGFVLAANITKGDGTNVSVWSQPARRAFDAVLPTKGSTAVER